MGSWVRIGPQYPLSLGLIILHPIKDKSPSKTFLSITAVKNIKYILIYIIVNFLSNEDLGVIGLLLLVKGD